MTSPEPAELTPEELTALLDSARDGDPAAAGQLFARVYDELHRLARRQLRAHGRPGATLDTTALVHEAFLRLAAPAGLRADDRAHFFNLAARVMRNIVVDFARRREADKRGGGVVRVELDTSVQVAFADDGLSIELLALEVALQGLEAASPDLARLVELRFFAGLELAEIADVTGRSERSLKRDWQRARAFLQASLEGRI